MEKKVLVFDPHLCTGCMYCMTACSTYHEGSTSLSKARLQIIRHEGHALTRTTEKDELVFIFTGCLQCEDPMCTALCPSGAIKTDASTGAIVIDHEKCVGCRTCLANCPFGAISFDQKKRQVFKCELCNGDPQCVRFCQSGALRFEPPEQEPQYKRGNFAHRAVEGQEKGKAEPDRGVER